MTLWHRRLRDPVEGAFWRIAASGLVPRGLFAPTLPTRAAPPSGGRYDLEIVSHCWGYGRFLLYQLSSLVLHPPARTTVRMTVFYSEEDERTREILDFFGELEAPNVVWNWWPQERTHLFRRAIGRNLSARSTEANWIWFTDCDLTFQAGALDDLTAELRDSIAVLAFPRRHQVSDLLDPDDPILEAADGPPAVIGLDRLDLAGFRPETRTKAVGAFQIVPGDVARRFGYCARIGLYQRPAAAFLNTWEDRTFRWLLGTRGTPLETSDFYRIRHAVKGRYGGRRSRRSPVTTGADRP